MILGDIKKEILTVEVHEKMPLDFVAKVEVSACYLEVEGRLLLLQCSADRQETGRWGVPAGKVEIGETSKEAAVRELFEETQISCLDVQDLGSLYIRKPDVDYIYHLFKVDLEERLAVCLSKEHEGYVWASKTDLEVLPLMAGAEMVLQFYREALIRRGF